MAAAPVTRDGKPKSRAPRGGGDDVPPPLVVVLGGNSVTAAMVMACINTTDTCALRRLHPAIAGTVAGVPWADMEAGVIDFARWHAALPAAVGALARCKSHRWKKVKIAPPMGITTLHIAPGCSSYVCDVGFIANNAVHTLPASLITLNVHGTTLPQPVSFLHLPALQTLDCSHTHAVDRGVGGLPASLSELRIECCNLSQSADFSHLTALRRLYCGTVELSAAVVASLPPSLELLDANVAPISDSIDWPPDASLAHLSRLRVLRVASVCDVTAALASLPATLTELDVSQCEHLGDATLATLPPSLVSLNTSWCDDLTEAAVLPYLPALQTLDMSHTSIGDATVASMPAGLVTLRLEGCIKVTPRASMDHLASLRELFTGNTDVPHAALAACRARGGFVPAGVTLHGHTGTVKALALLADGRLVSGSDDGTVRLWDPEAGGDATVVLHGTGGVTALAVLLDGRRVGVVSGGVLIVWDSTVAAEAGDRPRLGGVPIYLHCAMIAVAALHDGTLAVACAVVGHAGLDLAVRVVHPDTGTVVTTLMSGCKHMPLSLTVLHCGRLAIGMLGKEVEVWDVGQHRCVARLAGELARAAQVVDGRVATSGRGQVRLFDLTAAAATGPDSGDACEQAALPVQMDDLTALPDGRLAGSTEYGGILVWDTRDGGCRAPVPILDDCYNKYRYTVLLPLPGGRLATGSGGGKVQVWHLPA